MVVGGNRGKWSDYAQVDAMIFDALASLMTVTSLDKITVKAIAESAGVSRAAFYLQMTAETA